MGKNRDESVRGGPPLRGESLKQAWADWLGHLPWQLFVTLTFDPKIVFPVTAVHASKEAFWWCGQTARLLRSPVGWLYAVERGRSGQWHAHALLIGTRRQLGCGPEAIWRQRNGIIDVRPVYDAARVVLYTTKEAARTGEIVLSDTMRRYLPVTRPHVVVALHPTEAT